MTAAWQVLVASFLSKSIQGYLKILNAYNHILLRIKWTYFCAVDKAEQSSKDLRLNLVKISLCIKIIIRPLFKY